MNYYSLWDTTNSHVFPVPVTDWTDQLLGEGLDGVPAINVYRLHTWTWPYLDEDDAAALAAFFQRQQLGTMLSGIETDPYLPVGSPVASYPATVEYIDVRIKSVSRERGMGPYTSITAVFEIFAQLD